MDRSRYLCLVDAIIDMQERGFDLDFHLTGHRLLCSQYALLVRADDFDVLEMHYFPQCVECPCERMVYGIEIFSCGMKGILLSGTDKLTAFPEIINHKLRSYISKSRPGIHTRLL